MGRVSLLFAAMVSPVPDLARTDGLPAGTQDNPSYRKPEKEGNMNTGRKWQMVAMTALAIASVWLGRARADYILGAPKNLGPQVNSSDFEYDPAISADGLELYFQSYRAGGYGSSDLYVTKRVSIHDEWQPAQNLGPTVNSASGDSGPSLSADGLTLYFNSNRPGGFGGHDLYMTTRENRLALWGKPVNLGPAVNTEFGEINPNISRDGLSLYFADREGDSNVAPRPGGLGSPDIWLTTRASLADPWGPPANVGAPVNSGVTDGAPELSDDGLLLFFSRWFNDGTYHDIWVAARSTPQESWGSSAPLPTPANSDTWDANPELSADGRTLYFVSDRGNATGITDIWEISITPVVDLNGDGKVDREDIRAIMNNWGTNNPHCDIGPTPFGDGIVDMTDLEVLTRYASDDITDPTLLACYKFDETGGVVAVECAAACDGKLMGNPRWRPDAGAVGGAIELDGIDDYVSTALVHDPSRGAFSVFGWVKGGRPGQVILSQASGANWLVADGGTGALMTDLKSGARSNAKLPSQTVITDGNWHRIGLVWDGSHRTLYVDDEPVAEDTQNGLKSIYSDLAIGTGKDLAPGTFWSGLIDDVRIYTRVVKP
jgi:Tol biopolymer transport system component